ncbi:hypothetical protein Tco_0360300 [Tanacetum coccineum]
MSPIVILKEVILNGNKVLKRTIRETEQEYEPTTAEEKQDRRNEMKARGTLLMALPNKDQLKFHSYKDAKLLMEAIEKRYGGNKESKKVQRTLLKQQYEKFAGSSSETMDQIFDRLQKLISQLEIQGEVITQEGINLKLLRSLPFEWKTHALIWRNKEEIKTISLDDFTNSNSSTNEADNTAYEPNSTQLAREDLKQIDPDDLEEMDFTLGKVMLDIRARNSSKGQTEVGSPRNQENRGKENNRRTMTVETSTENALVSQDGIGGYDWSYQAEEEHPTNFALIAHTFSGSSSISDSEVDSCSKSCEKAYATLKEQYDNKVTNKFKTRLRYNAASSTVDSPIVESFVNSFEMLENQENNKSKYDKGYHAVSATFYRNSFPSNLKIMFMDEIVESENMDVITIVTPSNGKKVESNHETDDVKSNGDAVEPKTVRKNNFRPPVIEDWNSDDDSPKESEKDSGMKPTEEDVSGALNKDGEDDQATRNTWLVTAGPSFTNDDPSSPVNVVEASNAFKEHLFERFSPLKNAFILPPVSNVTLMDDTEFFGNAYDDEDVGADADLKNLETTINMDVKSAFLYGTIKREVKIWSTSYFEDPQFPDKPRKYVAEILKKFDFAIVKTTSTPMEPNKALVKDEEAEAVDVYLYRSMIGSLKT